MVPKPKQYLQAINPRICSGKPKKFDGKTAAIEPPNNDGSIPSLMIKSRCSWMDCSDKSIAAERFKDGKSPANSS